jgi:8-oxo-dGTP pyrophosphatase MutT (NUDIX family)
MARVTFTGPQRDTWYAALPGVVIAAGALITDPGGQVLLVKANYRDDWTLPGGVCERGEPPHAGCAREVAEEIGLRRPAGPLLAVDWSLIYGEHQRPLMHFVFDGGTVADGSGIVLQADELENWQFAGADELARHMSANGVARARAALAGRAAGAAVYQPSPLS